MAGIANGMAYHGGVRPFVATFFCFSDYMRPSVRLAALNELPVIFVWTHDSIGLGEDGPTHQPVEHLAAAGDAGVHSHPSRRRQRGAGSVADGGPARRWSGRAGPLAPEAPGLRPREATRRPRVSRGSVRPGGGVASARALVLIATGSEVALALQAREKLEGEGIATRVVSMPSWELFDRQPPEYREQVLPRAVPARLAVEAGASLGWKRYVGDGGDCVGLDRYGASAPGEIVMKELGFSVENVVQRAKALL